jgi:tetratricopeptide (TPR) repeat protein
MLHQTGRVDEGIFAIRRAIAIRPAAIYYSNLGNALQDSGRHTEAIECYRLAIAERPEFAEAFNNRGFAHYLRGDAELAIADFTRAIELRPNYPKAYNSRGVVFMSNGYESSRAIADFDRAIALKPDFRYAYINRANARLVRHPWLALNDFHQAGMHPERVLMGGAAVMLAVGLIVVRRRRVRRARV